jgi:hypothetical protein
MDETEEACSTHGAIKKMGTNISWVVLEGET